MDGIVITVHVQFGLLVGWHQPIPLLFCRLYNNSHKISNPIHIIGPTVTTAMRTCNHVIDVGVCVCVSVQVDYTTQIS